MNDTRIPAFHPLRTAGAALACVLLAGCASVPAAPPHTLHAGPRHHQLAPAASSSVPPAPEAATNPAPATRGTERPVRDVMPSDTAGERLADAIDGYIDQPRFAHADWGISVINADTRAQIYAHRAGKLFIPASNTKLYTAALALRTLGAGFRFRTTLFATRHPDGRGVLHGDLVLYGRGDPSLGSGTDTQSPMAWADQLAGILRTRGVHRVEGDLIADDTFYAGPPFGAGWEANDLESGFAAEPAALSVQGNTFTLALGGNGACCTARVDPAAAGVHVVNLLHAPARSNSPGAVAEPLGLYRAPGSDRLYVFGTRPATQAPRIFTLAAPDPARLAGGLLTDALTRQHIQFLGKVRTLHWPQPGALDTGHALLRVSDIRSQPLKDLVTHMLKTSDNLYAQLLFMAAGKRYARSGTCPGRTRPPTLAADWGACAMRVMLRDIGMPPGSAHFEEGSGLSRKDLVTPDATTFLLAWIDRQPFATVIHHALPLAGVDGTLEYRLRGPLTRGRIQAKTGTLHYAYALSGYVTAANGTHLAFSIMLNNYARPDDAGSIPEAPRPEHDLDAIARAIAGYGRMVPPAGPVHAADAGR